MVFRKFPPNQVLLSNFQQAQTSSLTTLLVPTNDPKMKAKKIVTTKSNISIEEVREELGNCTRCDLYKDRKNNCIWLREPSCRPCICWRGTWADEDEQGFPFVGRAGKKLTEIIEKGMNLNREEDTYICNIVKCRPPNNRDPKPDEIEACNPFLNKATTSHSAQSYCCIGQTCCQHLVRKNGSDYERTRAAGTSMRGFLSC